MYIIRYERHAGRCGQVERRGGGGEMLRVVIIMYITIYQHHIFLKGRGLRGRRRNKSF